MSAYYRYLNTLISENKELFRNDDINWVNPYESQDFQLKRDVFLADFAESALFNNTKPFLNQISQGCQLCGQGLWSCLFITSKCNASCFYCPTSQLKDEVPESQGLKFDSPEAYAEYVNYFGFKGASFSGGEPLLYFDRVKAYLTELRKSCSPDLYIWMYTNGILASEDYFKELAGLGINEVRFDIGATGFKLDAIEKAKNIIPNITIEIPAVPEEKDKLIKLLPQMIDRGVTNLNLHQMRLTPYNLRHLLIRNYTIIPAERPIVLESELAALEIMQYAKQADLPLGINYCSFFFKNQHQKAGFRRVLAEKLTTNEEITEKGFIKKLTNKKLQFDGLMLLDNDLKQDNLQALQLSHKKYYYIRTKAFETSVDDLMDDKILHSKPQNPPEGAIDFEVWQHMYIEQGLRDY